MTKDRFTAESVAFGVCSIVGLIGLGLGTFHILPSSLWQDELYTLANFVLKGPAVVVTDYHVPNNHIFSNLLSTIFAPLAPQSPVVARTVSLLSVIAIGAVAVCLRNSRTNRFGAAVLLLVVGVTMELQYLLLQLRGYGLLFALTLLFCLALRSSATHWAALALGVLMAYTLPTALIFPVTAFLLMAVVTGERRYLFANLYLLCGVALLYAPVARQLLAVQSRYSQRWGEQFGDPEVLVEFVRFYCLPYVQRDIRTVVVFVTCAVLLLALIRGLLRSDPVDRALSGAVAATLAAFFVLKTPPLRTAVFLIVPLAMLVGRLISEVFNSTSRPKLFATSMAGLAVYLFAI
ncbi:MAG: hypothetical protein AAFQ82_28070, partial [Myxococcota bacterium]